MGSILGFKCKCLVDIMYIVRARDSVSAKIKTLRKNIISSGSGRFLLES